VNQALLQVRALRKAFGRKQVLDGVDLEVTAGRITTIVGKSGTGKTVLLKCVAGLLDADSGDILVDGSAPGLIDRSTGERRVSYMFQNNALFDAMTATENVALPLIESSSLPRRDIFRRVGALLEKLDLRDAGNRYPAELSGGMQKRVALARTLITNPRLVLFDEPTTGLDPIRKNAVLEMIARYRQAFGFTALMVTHDLPEALYVSDTVAVLEAGKVVFTGTPTELEAADNRDGTDRTRSEEVLRRELAGASSWAEFQSQFGNLCADASHIVGLTLRRQGAALSAADRFASFDIIRGLAASLAPRPWACGRACLPDSRSLLLAVRRPGVDGDSILAEVTATAAAAGLTSPDGAQAPFRIEGATLDLRAHGACPERARTMLASAVKLFDARPVKTSLPT
jgi:phospholipid/cholesterol/gamma-HCH transport system ATP-binding protein